MKILLLFSFFPVLFMPSADASDVITIATIDNIPNAYIEDGTPSGRLVDIVSEAFRRAGYPVEYRFLPRARRQAEVETGGVDAAFTLLHTSENDKNLLFSEEPILMQRLCFFVRKGSSITFNGDYTSLAATTLGILIGNSYGTKLDRALAAGIFPRIEEVRETNALVRMLVAGRVGVISSSQESVWTTARLLHVEEQIEELTPSEETVGGYLVFTRQRDMTSLARAYNEGLRSMKMDGTFDRITSQYP